MRQVAVTAALLAAACVCSAVAVVYTKHLSRNGYAEISRNQKQIDNLDVQWSQLQIEESTFSGHGRVERTAQDRLGMSVPGLQDSIMIVR